MDNMDGLQKTYSKINVFIFIPCDLITLLIILNPVWRSFLAAL